MFTQMYYFFFIIILGPGPIEVNIKKSDWFEK